MKRIVASLLFLCATAGLIGCTIITNGEAKQSPKSGKSDAPPPMVQTSNAPNRSAEPANPQPGNDTKPLPARPVATRPTPGNTAQPIQPQRPSNARPIATGPNSNIQPSGSAIARPSQPGRPNMTNPADDNCVKLGGAVHQYKDAKGEFGVCHWRDGSRCENWALYHKKCKQGECRAPNGICNNNAGMANPASKHCEKKGGKLEILNEPGGQIGVCVFKDYSRCEEWAFYRGKCKPGQCFQKKGQCQGQPDSPNPAAKHCEKIGGKVSIVPGMKEGEQLTVCTFKDYTRCEVWRLYNKQCKPGQCKSKKGICDDQPGMANPASKHCQKKGGKVEILKTDQGEIGVCVFKDGSRCEEWRYYKKQCDKGWCHTKNGICAAKGKSTIPRGGKAKKVRIKPPVATQ